MYIIYVHIILIYLSYIDKVERFFRLIKKPESEYIYKDDFIPFLQGKYYSSSTNNNIL